jgi:chromosome segregation ATPase
VLQAPALSASAAAVLHDQLAEAQAQAQAAAAENATLQQLLDSERASMADGWQELEAAQEAQQAAAAEYWETWQARLGQMEADAAAARAELNVFRAQVRLAEHRLPGLLCRTVVLPLRREHC